MTRIEMLKDFENFIDDNQLYDLFITKNREYGDDNIFAVQFEMGYLSKDTLKHNTFLECILINLDVLMNKHRACLILNSNNLSKVEIDEKTKDIMLYEKIKEYIKKNYNKINDKYYARLNKYDSEYFTECSYDYWFSMDLKN